MLDLMAIQTLLMVVLVRYLPLAAVVVAVRGTLRQAAAVVLAGTGVHQAHLVTITTTLTSAVHRDLIVVGLLVMPLLVIVILLMYQLALA
jgi:hypothetical protein